MRFITDYQRRNQQLLRNPYPLNRKVDTINRLEGFQYNTALDLIMGYYTISLYPDRQYMTTKSEFYSKLTGDSAIVAPTLTPPIPASSRPSKVNENTIVFCTRYGLLYHQTLYDFINY